MLNIQMKKGYVLEEYKSLRAIKAEYPNTTKVMEKNGWTGSVILSRGNYLYTGNVDAEGKIGKLLRVPAGDQ